MLQKWRRKSARSCSDKSVGLKKIVHKSEKILSNTFNFRRRPNTQKKEKMDQICVRLDNLPENLNIFHRHSVCRLR